MTYTVRISGNSPQALSIINMLKAFQEEFDYIDITEESMDYTDKELSPEFLEELEKRAEYMENHPDEGKSWDEIKKKYTAK
ncbi:MAG TPA: hypothetical protein VIH57_08520 [Bacteroidales bacterium]